jgi:hypothetical protein
MSGDYKRTLERKGLRFAEGQAGGQASRNASRAEAGQGDGKGGPQRPTANHGVASESVPVVEEIRRDQDSRREERIARLEARMLRMDGRLTRRQLRGLDTTALELRMRRVQDRHRRLIIEATGASGLAAHSFPPSGTSYGALNVLESDLETVTGGSGGFNGMCWGDPDGNTLLVGNNNTDVINVLVADSAYDLATGFSNGTAMNPASKGWFVPGPVGFNPDGTQFIMCEFIVNDRLESWTLSTPFDLSSHEAVAGRQTVQPESNWNSTTRGDLRGGCMSRDSSKLFLITRRSDNSYNVEQWDFGTPGDITTLTFNSAVARTGSQSGICVSGDDNTLLVSTGSNIITYDISSSDLGSAPAGDEESMVSQLMALAPDPVGGGFYWVDTSGRFGNCPLS